MSTLNSRIKKITKHILNFFAEWTAVTLLHWADMKLLMICTGWCGRQYPGKVSSMFNEQRSAEILCVTLTAVHTNNWSQWQLVTLTAGYTDSWSHWQLVPHIPVTVTAGYTNSWSHRQLVTVTTGHTDSLLQWQLVPQIPVTVTIGYTNSWSHRQLVSLTAVHTDT